MKKEDLDALAGLYKSVYLSESGEYLSEDYIDEQLKGFNGKPIPVSAADKKRAENEARFQQRAAAYKAKGGSNYAAYLAGGGNKAKSLSPSAAPQDIERQGKSALNAKAAKDKITNASQADKNKAAENIFKLKPGSLTKPPTPAAAKPAATLPATKPATPASGAKVAPTAAKPAPGTKAAGPDSIKPKTPNPLMRDMPGQNKAELDQLRGNAAISSISQSPSAKNILSGRAKSATANEIGKASLDRSAAATEAKPPAPKISATTPSTAFAKTSPSLSSSSAAVKSAGSAAAAKPTTNQTATAFSNPSLRPTPSTTPIKKPGAVMSSFEWGSKATLKDIAGAYASIYEGKKKDQDQDGDNDFADVRIARMIASGMSKAEAIAAVRNKEYNEEFESWVDSLVEEGYDLSDYTMDEMFDIYLDEATLSAKAARAGKDIGAKGKNFAKIAASAGERYGSVEAGKRVAGAILKKMRANEEFELDEATRMRKELGKEGETAVRKELAARSKAYKRSGSVDRTIAAAERAADWSGDEKKAKTLRGLASSRRGSVRDKPRAGMRGYAAKVEGGDKDLQSARQRAMSAGTLTPKEKKQLGEVYEIVASYLLENNFAATLNDANVIIENMSEVWLDQILTEKSGEQPLPYGRMMKKSDELADSDDKKKRKRAASIYLAANAPKGPKIKVR